MVKKAALLKNQVVWIIGGGSGIGRSIALRLPALGATVWISGRREAMLKETAKIAKKNGFSIKISVCDAVSPSQLEQTVDKIGKVSGRIDSLVISVGHTIPGTLESISFEQWQEMQRAHLDAMFFSCKKALPLLKKSASASILIIGSIFGLRGKENRLAYCTMKGGVVNFVRALALDLAGKVRVNSICPGWVKTEMSMSLVREAADPAKELVLRHGWHPMGRGGEPEDIAGLAIFLLSLDSCWMTGQNIAIDGGYTAR